MVIGAPLDRLESPNQRPNPLEHNFAVIWAVPSVRPFTGRPSLPPTSFTPYPISFPCGRATTGVGDVGLTQLPIEKNADGVAGAYAPAGLIGCRRPTGEWGGLDFPTNGERGVNGHPARSYSIGDL